MSRFYKHQESRKESPFLWLRFIPNNYIEVLTDKLPSTVDITKIDGIIKKLYPTARYVARDRVQ